MWKKKTRKTQFAFNAEKVFLAAAQPLDTVWGYFQTTRSGLTGEEIENRQEVYGKNEVEHEKKKNPVSAFIKAFINPFIGVLTGLVVISFVLDVLLAEPGEQDWTAIVIISTMVIVSTILRFCQEWKANVSSEALLKMVTNFEVTGLKTGSTSLAKYCLSATGRKDGVDLIAVILAAPDYKARFADAVTLLNYGFANCHLYKDENPGAVPETTVAGGIQEQVAGRLRGTFSYLSMGGENLDGIEKEWMMEESRKAPVREGDVIGHLVYRLDGRKLGSVEIEAAETVEKAGLWDYFKKVMGVFAA